MSVAIFLFSSRKKLNFSDTSDSTATRATGVPSLPLVCPSNSSNASGILRDIIAVNPSLTSLPSKVLSFPLI